MKGLNKVVQRGEEVAEGGQGACEELWRSSCPAGALSSSTTTAKDSLRWSRLRTKTLRRDRYARSLPPRRCELTVPPHQLPPKIDLLSSLPVETLTAIFKMTYSDSSPSTGPISQALLPFDREIRFRHLEVKSIDKLRMLPGILETGEKVLKGVEMGQWVMEVKFEQVDGPSTVLTERQIKSFFAALPHLEQLTLGEQNTSIQRFVLSNAGGRASLRKMKKLSFHDLKGKNPFEPTLLCLLPSYPSLTSLSIVSDKSYSDLHRLKASKKKVDKLNNITELSLTSEGSDLPLIQRLVEACPSLDTLKLSVTSHQPDFPPLIPLLPSTLTHLELRTLPFYDSFSRPCEVLLPEFSSLHTLYLGEETFTTAVFPTLRQLPFLTSLGFGKGALVPVPELIALVDSAAPLPCLKTLTLDIVEGKSGWRFAEDGDYRLHPEADPITHMGPGWTFPFFSAVFNDKPVQEAIEKIEAAGVKVEGTTVDAIRFVMDYYIEMSMCADAWALETGDFSELRRDMGEEYVQELLLLSGYCEGYDECECGECY